MKLDRIDMKIINALLHDGRMTKVRLAAEAGLSPAACWDRLRRLEEGGVIRGYRAIVDLGESRAPTTTVIVEVTLKSHRHADFRLFEAMVAREPAIIACDATGGGIDYILRIACRDIEAYQSLVERLLSAQIGIDRYFSYIVTKPVKHPDTGLAATGAQGR